MKKTTFTLNEIARINDGKMVYTVMSADKKEPVKTFSFKLYEAKELKMTGNPKMDAFIEKANAKIAEMVKDLNNPENYTDKDDKTGEYTLKKLNSVTTFTSRKTNIINTLIIFSKVDLDAISDNLYQFMINMTALDRKVEVKAYEGMTIAEFYAANGSIKKSFNEFIEILNEKGLRFSDDMTHIVLL